MKILVNTASIMIALFAIITNVAQAQSVPDPTPRCDRQTAEPHIRAGAIAFQRGDFAMAFEESCEAFRLCPTSANIRDNVIFAGIAWRSREHLVFVLTLIEDALRAQGLTAEQRETLNAQRANARRTLAALSPPPTPHPDPGRPVVVHRSRTGGWVATIAGGGLLAASIAASIISAQAVADQAAIERGEYLPNDAVPTTRDVSLGIAIGAGLGGAALTIYGAYLILRPDEVRRPTPATVTFLPGGGVLAGASVPF